MKVEKRDGFPKGTVCPQCKEEMITAHVMKKIIFGKDRYFCTTPDCGNDVTDLVGKIDINIS